MNFVVITTPAKQIKTGYACISDAKKTAPMERFFSGAGGD